MISPLVYCIGIVAAFGAGFLTALGVLSDIEAAKSIEAQENDRGRS